MSAVTLTIVSQEQNVVDYLNQLQVNNSLMDNTIINSTQELISGCSKHSKKNYSNIIYFFFYKSRHKVHVSKHQYTTNTTIDEQKCSYYSRIS